MPGFDSTITASNERLVASRGNAAASLAVVRLASLNACLNWFWISESPLSKRILKTEEESVMKALPKKRAGLLPRANLMSTKKFERNFLQESFQTRRLRAVSMSTSSGLLASSLMPPRSVIQCVSLHRVRRMHTRHQDGLCRRASTLLVALRVFILRAASPAVRTCSRKAGGT
jgi:hypothetical protein